MLWDLFETKATSLGASVVHTSDVAGALPPLRSPAEVVAHAELAIAETGSVLVSLPQPERAAALLAERLWIVVRAADIVANLDQALTHVHTLIAAGRPYATFMSGPSRTADIERALTIGVHGPRALTIVVVEEARSRWSAPPETAPA